MEGGRDRQRHGSEDFCCYCVTPPHPLRKLPILRGGRQEGGTGQQTLLLKLAQEPHNSHLSHHPPVCVAKPVPAAAATAAVVPAGASLSVEGHLIPALIPLLTANSHAVQETAAFALARLAQLPSYRHATFKVCVGLAAQHGTAQHGAGCASAGTRANWRHNAASKCVP